jgi:hypothetical protein
MFVWYFFLLLWRTFTFCRFDHKLLFHSVYFQSVVVKLRFQNFAKPQAILRVKFVPNLPMETCTGSKEIVLHLGTGWRSLINFKPQPLYAWERIQDSMNRRSVGPRSSSGGCKKQKNSLPHARSRNLNLPACSQVTTPTELTPFLYK